MDVDTPVDRSGAPLVAAAPERVTIGSYLITNAALLESLIVALQAARREAFGVPKPSASIVEIIERGDREVTEGPGSLILPTDVRINGVSVYTSGGVKIHEIGVAPCKDMVQVTVTLPARRVIIGAESDIQPGPVTP